MTLVERELKPVFLEDLFHFEDPALIPDHYEEWPEVPNFLGQWAVFGWSGGHKTMNFAVDVVSAEQAELIAEAKKQYFEASIELYRHTLDVYILSPDGAHQRYYFGRSI